MSLRARGYLIVVLAVGTLLAINSLLGSGSDQPDWLLFVILVLFATLAHFFEAVGPHNEAWNANLAFYFAGVLTLPPSFFTLLVIIPHLIQWLILRITNSPSLRKWYIQPFNIAVHLIAGLSARAVMLAVHNMESNALSNLPLWIVLAGIFVYVGMNHLLIAAILVLARGHSWRQSGLLDVENFLLDGALLSGGFVIAILWANNPWLIVLALASLVMTYRALKIPQLEKQAQTDSKTGLLNMRRFNELFSQELQRAQRFNRPLALIMADLDLLRNINNTYGHMAGDRVLADIGQLIQSNSREFDIPARFGGEEFCIVMLESRNEEVVIFAERLRKLVEAHEFKVPASEAPIRVTMSFGIACYPQDGTSVEQLIHLADLAVYQAKAYGRNSVVSASELPGSKQDPSLDS